MSSSLVDENGRLVGTRVTVLNLLVDFLDAERTEVEIADFYGITPQQVAAGRAYVFENIDQVLKRHLEIEQRNATGNSPELLAEGERIRELHGSYQNWILMRRDEMKRARADEVNSAAHWSRSFGMSGQLAACPS